jgi:hypothetical protein
MFRVIVRRGVVIAGIGAVLLPAVGCGHSVSVPRRDGGYIVGTQGAGSEVVFHGVQVLGAEMVAGDEQARRDEALASRADRSVFEALAWPQAPMPSLDRARRLYVPERANAHLYFGARTHESHRYRFRSNLHR